MLFPLTPDKVTKVGRSFKTTVITFESQNKQHFSNDHVGKRKFKLDMLLSPADFETFDDFFGDHLGKFKAFEINDSRISGSTVSANFASDSYEATPVKGDKAYKISVEIET